MRFWPIRTTLSAATMRQEIREAMKQIDKLARLAGGTLI
jgi:hypothetical protein